MDRPHSIAVAFPLMCAAALLAFAALQYLMPANYSSSLSSGCPSVAEWWDTLLPSVPARSLEAPCFYRYLAAAILLTWFTYAVSIVAIVKGHCPGARATIGLCIAVWGFFAVACPPSLSCDSYAYIGYAKLLAVYSQNPYLVSPSQLAAHGDPVARFLVWDLPCPYGPVWLQTTALIAALLDPAGLWWQVVSVKLVSALALMAAALWARAIAEDTKPGSGNLALMAVGLNPLLVIEGPGNGHNDLLMIALLLGAVRFDRRGSRVVSDLLLGLSVGIKLITVVVVPWVILHRMRGLSPMSRITVALKTVVAVMLPLCLCCVGLWAGTRTFKGLLLHLTAGPGNVPVTQVLSSFPDAAGQRDLPAFFELLARHWLLGVVYVVLTLLVCRARREHDWATAWVVMALCMAGLSKGVWFPWYMIWNLPVSLSRWDWLHTRMSVVLCAVALGLSLVYAVPYRSAGLRGNPASLSHSLPCVSVATCGQQEERTVCVPPGHPGGRIRPAETRLR